LAQLDRYRDFKELVREQCEDRDWRRVLIDRRTVVTIVAPHGGGIEAGTSEIATALAGQEFSLYCFEGIKPRGNQILHITSTRFDDLECLEHVGSTPIAVTVHGCADSGEAVYVGGLNEELRLATVRSLRTSGFFAVEDTAGHGGFDPANICNRCLTRRGLQLEITTDLRGRMFAGLRASERNITTLRFGAFVSAIRTILLPAPSNHLGEPNPLR
jgi:phage replication-related protein YjqB (UPF0714/DUF867 family)